MSSSPPSTLGKYQIIREIARSNDIVYEGYDPLMTRRVAVKELNAPVGATPQQLEDRIQRFKREAQAAGRLNHPNIMTVYDVEEDQGRLFMAMEYLDGQTLRAEIDQHANLTPERAVDVACAVLAGLDHAHKQGVVHRDIKPDNVQILSNGSIKITDFGIARLTFQPNLTMDGQVFGTPSYMSPEQVVGKDIDARSDLFSVGVMLYEMLTGRKPFPGDNVITITTGIVNREPDPLPDSISWSLAEAVRKSLEKVPHLRFTEAAEMSDALKDALRPAPQPTYDPIPQTPIGGYGAPQVNPYNPYGAPTPPPVINQPYNPYGAQQNPYAPPIPQTAPPPTYGYNPYTQQPYGGPGPSMPPPQGMQVPVYYPPPPRQPLLKPETSAFLKKLIISFIVFGTFFALILVGAQAIITTIGRMSATQQSQSIVETLNGVDQNLPLEDQIARIRDLRSKVPAGASTAEFDRKLGDRYLQLANQHMQGNRLEQAEQALQQAQGFDSHNPNLLISYGNFFKQLAEGNTRGPQERADLYRQASEKYFSAADQTTDPQVQGENRLAGARMAYLFAYNANESGDPESKRAARQVLNAAQPYASTDRELAQGIANLLASLRS